MVGIVGDPLGFVARKDRRSAEQQRIGGILNIQGHASYLLRSLGGAVTGDVGAVQPGRKLARSDCCTILLQFNVTSCSGPSFFSSCVHQAGMNTMSFGTIRCGSDSSSKLTTPEPACTT